MQTEEQEMGEARELGYNNYAHNQNKQTNVLGGGLTYVHPILGMLAAQVYSVTL